MYMYTYGCMYVDGPTQSFTHLFAFMLTRTYVYGMHESLLTMLHTRTYIYMQIPLLLYIFQLSVNC